MNIQEEKILRGLLAQNPSAGIDAKAIIGMKIQPYIADFLSGHEGHIKETLYIEQEDKLYVYFLEYGSQTINLSIMSGEDLCGVLRKYNTYLYGRYTEATDERYIRDRFNIKHPDCHYDEVYSTIVRKSHDRWLYHNNANQELALCWPKMLGYLCDYLKDPSIALLWKDKNLRHFVIKKAYDRTEQSEKTWKKLFQHGKNIEEILKCPRWIYNKKVNLYVLNEARLLNERYGCESYTQYDRFTSLGLRKSDITTFKFILNARDSFTFDNLTQYLIDAQLYQALPPFEALPLIKEWLTYTDDSAWYPVDVRSETYNLRRKKTIPLLESSYNEALDLLKEAAIFEEIPEHRSVQIIVPEFNEIALLNDKVSSIGRYLQDRISRFKSIVLYAYDCSASCVLAAIEITSSKGVIAYPVTPNDKSARTVSDIRVYELVDIIKDSSILDNFEFPIDIEERRLSA